MDKIKVVHIIPTLTFGGAERFVIDLANNSSDKIENEIVILKDEKALASELENYIDIHLVEKEKRLSLGLFSKLEEKLKGLNPDVVHTHLFGADVWGRVAAKRLDLPVVTTEHNVNKQESSIKGFAKRLLNSYSDKYTAPSEAVKKYMQSHYSIDKQNIDVVLHGINLDKFLYTDPFISHKPLKLLMLGRLTKQKGHDIALKALSKIDKNDWMLDIVGDGENYSYIEKIIKEFGLEDNVKLWDPTLDVVDEYNEHDVVLMPSRWEGLGLVAIEAMAAGRVVVGTNVEGLNEVIKNGVNGLMVKPEDPKALARRVLFCIQNDNECGDIARKARKYAKKYFSIEDMVKKYEKIYQELAS